MSCRRWDCRCCLSAIPGPKDRAPILSAASAAAISTVWTRCDRRCAGACAGGVTGSDGRRRQPNGHGLAGHLCSGTLTQTGGPDLASSHPCELLRTAMIAMGRLRIARSGATWRARWHARGIPSRCATNSTAVGSVDHAVRSVRSTAFLMPAAERKAVPRVLVGGDAVAIRVGKDHGASKGTIVGLLQNRDPSRVEPGVELVNMITIDPECDTPA